MPERAVKEISGHSPFKEVLVYELIGLDNALTIFITSIGILAGWIQYINLNKPYFTSRINIKDQPADLNTLETFLINTGNSKAEVNKIRFSLSQKGKSDKMDLTFDDLINKLTQLNLNANVDYQIIRYSDNVWFEPNNPHLIFKATPKLLAQIKFIGVKVEYRSITGTKFSNNLPVIPYKRNPTLERIRKNNEEDSLASSLIKCLNWFS